MQNNPTAIDQLINHIALVLDSSTSMSRHSKKVIEVANSVIKDLAEKSRDFNQETRITIYQFASEIKCLVYDKDVLRLPDISQMYKVYGNTALLAATVKSIDDLMLQPQLYGDHAFFDTVITDGQENESYRHRVTVGDLATRLRLLPDNWTMATLVPDERGIRDAVSFGFEKENCGVWDTNSISGFEGVGSTIRTATAQFFTNRSKGIRRSSGIFNLNTSGLNPAVVASTLTELTTGQYNMYGVYEKTRIDNAVYAATGDFRLGQAFYQLMKPEEIQPQKAVCVRDRKTLKVYSGPAARNLIGLPNYSVRVNPDSNPNYDIFVQSTAPNRNLVPGTEVLVMK